MWTPYMPPTPSLLTSPLNPYSFHPTQTSPVLPPCHPAPLPSPLQQLPLPHHNYPFPPPHHLCPTPPHTPFAVTPSAAYAPIGTAIAEPFGQTHLFGRPTTRPAAHFYSANLPTSRDFISEKILSMKIVLSTMKILSVENLLTIQ